MRKRSADSRMGVTMARCARRRAYRRGAFACAVTVCLAGAACSGGWQPRADAERLLRVLADDAMQGRRAFTPGAEAAAEVIAAEFEAIGLQPLPGQEDLQQRFSVTSYEPAEVSVTIDGVAVQPQRAAAWLAEERIEWEPGAAELVVVGPDDPAPFAALRRVRGGGGDALVLLDPAHEEAFARIRRFLSAPRRLLPGESAASLVMAVAPAPLSGRWSVSARAQV